MSLVDITTDAQTRIAEITLNRPEKLNAFNPELITALFSALAAADADQAVSCIVLRGAGRAFSVGYDFNSAIERRSEGEPETPLDDWRRMAVGDADTWLRVRQMLTPVVAGIHGYCLGAAAMLATCSDVVVASDDVQIGWASVRGGGGWLGPGMALYIGARKARELELRYGRISGAEAERWGWANYALPAAEVRDKALEIAYDIAKTPLELLQIKKRSMNMAQETPTFAGTVAAGALWDAIGHYSASGQQTSRQLHEVGLREAIRRSKEGAPLGSAAR
jgi:enoyl-CoA hydratase